VAPVGAKILFKTHKEALLLLRLYGPLFMSLMSIDALPLCQGALTSHSVHRHSVNTLFSSEDQNGS